MSRNYENMETDHTQKICEMLLKLDPQSSAHIIDSPSQNPQTEGDPQYDGDEEKPINSKNNSDSDYVTKAPPKEGRH